MLSHPLAFITYRKTSPKPTNGQTTSCTSVPGTLAAVARRSLKTIAQAVRNGSGVTDRNYWQLPQNTLNGDDLENWFLVVELVDYS